MEIPRLRLLMQGLHVIESGKIDPTIVSNQGWAHAVSFARNKRIGRTAEQVITDFKLYSDEKDAARVQRSEGILVIGLQQSVLSE